jgi:hypothetical protein
MLVVNYFIITPTASSNATTTTTTTTTTYLTHYIKIKDYALKIKKSHYVRTSFYRHVLAIIYKGGNNLELKALKILF